MPWHVRVDVNFVLIDKRGDHAMGKTEWISCDVIILINIPQYAVLMEHGEFFTF